MNTYLLTWNPAKWPWADLEECVLEVKTTGHHLDRWSCGRNRKINEGDRLFLIRQGQEPRGIVGSGWAVSIVFDDQHWDDPKRAKGQRALYVEMDFDVLLDAEREPIVNRDQLNEGVLAQMHWDSQCSGILIPDKVAKQLEMEWAKGVSRRCEANQQSEINHQKSQTDATQ